MRNVDNWRAMKRFIALTVVLTAGIGLSIAFAGPERYASKEVAPVAPACTWTGFYIGVHAGITDLQSRFSNLNNWAPDNEAEGNNWNTMTWDTPAFIGGGQAGYNYQWKDLVMGIEADFSGLPGAENSRHMSSGESGGFEDEGYNMKARVDFMGTLRGRLGISFNDNRALVYGTAGGAYAHGKWDVLSLSENEPDLTVDWRGDDWRWGWVAGFGFQYALNCHWSLRAEALYTWLLDDTQGINRSNSGSSFEDYTNRFRFDDNLATYRLGLDYKF